MQLKNKKIDPSIIKKVRKSANRGELGHGGELGHPQWTPSTVSYNALYNVEYQGLTYAGS